LRDVVVNHLMQVVGAAAMEPPSGMGQDALRDAAVTLFRAVTAADPAHYVRGQYEGYQSIDGVAEGSTTETYAALRLEIDNWRWQGVPFYIRTGKKLPVTQTELRVVFREPPPVHLGLGAGQDRRPVRDEFVVKLDPSTGTRLIVDAHRADGQGPRAITLDAEFADEGGEGATPYEVLLHAAIVGDSSRFGRQDIVEETWRIMQPLIDDPPPVHPYAPGSWGPAIASTLVSGHGGWQGPWIVESDGDAK
jgi:glucose-6-phosphate 1-dehydrogenase